MEVLHAASEWLKATLLPYGGIGLLLLAVCDSSFLSLPEVNDILLMTLSINEPESMVWLAFMTTAGSVIGCSMLYSVGRSGGDVFLRRRFSAGKLNRVREWYGRYGLFAIIVPSVLPPPMPFKVFVLSAGAFGISWPRFLAAVTIGRGIRYFSGGVLAVLYGQAALAFVRDNYGKVAIAAAALVVAAVLVFALARHRMGSETV